MTRSNPRPVLVALLAIAASTPTAFAQHVWVRKTEGATLYYAGMAFDPVRGHLLRFGGQRQDLQRTTEEWDGSQWVNLAPDNAPAARSDPAMATDEARHRVVLFGGYGSGALGDTWEWDGLTWTQRQPAVSPLAQSNAAMAYDARRQRIVLFGGADNTTWEWDGSTWVGRHFGVEPPARKEAGLAYDAARQRIVLHGSGTYGATRTDTWEYDGTAWTQRSASGPVGGAMAYDPVRQRCVLIPRVGSNTETWEWDGSTWTLQGSGYLQDRALAYDPSSGVAIDGGARLATWDGAVWTEHGNEVHLPGVTSIALANDEAHGEVVAFGGWYPDPGGRSTPSGLTTVWDGQRWRRPQLSLSPTARGDHAMAYDVNRQRVVLYGGNGYLTGPYNDTWEWDGLGWRQVVTSQHPPNGSGARMVYDRGRGLIVLVTGQGASGQTWEYGGTDWQPVTTTLSPPTFGPMAYDLGRGKTVLVSGAQTWEYDGTDWTVQTPVPAPSGSGVMAYDPSLRGVVFLDRKDFFGSPVYDTRVWDGVRWTALQLATPVPYYGAMVYDLVHGVTLLASGNYENDLWALTRTPAANLRTNHGCGGTGPTPWLDGLGRPTLGNAGYAIDLGAAPAGAAGGLFVGAGSTTVALGGGCTLYLDPGRTIVAVPVVTGPAGSASLGLPIPSQPVWLGQSVFAQGAVLDPLGPFHGLVLSRGLQVQIGE